MSPRLSIITVAYNRRDDLRTCLRSVQRLTYANRELLVLDNASADGSADMVAAEFPEARLYRSARNLGLCAARNAAAQLCEADYLWFIDNDAEIVDPQAAERLVGLMEAEPTLGALGGEGVVNEAGELVGAKTLDLCRNGMVIGNFRLDLPAYELAPAQTLAGSNLLVRRGAFLKLKGFDANYVWHWEDIDFAYRLEHQLGLRLAVVGMVPVIHHFSGASRRLGSSMPGRSRMYFILKNLPLSRIVLLPLYDLGFALDPRNFARLFQRAKRMKFGQKGVVVKSASDSRGPSASDLRKVTLVGFQYLRTLVSGYFYIFAVLRQARAARRGEPDHLANVDVAAFREHAAADAAAAP